jgi:hypothetical protein
MTPGNVALASAMLLTKEVTDAPLMGVTATAKSRGD